jgi:hypothetical protein
MTHRKPTGLWIGPASQNELDEALSLIYGRLSAEDRAERIDALRAEIQAGRVPPDGLLVARREGQLAGAVFSQIHTGKSAVIWPPRLRSNEPPATVEQLLDAVCDWLGAGGVQVAHALLENDDPQDIAVLQRGGFQPLATLLYLFSQEAAFPLQSPPTVLEFEPYSRASHQRLASLVEVTYVGSLDCPGLDNVRKIEDVLAGYRATGVFSPARWLIVRHQGQDVGCLLLADHPDAESWELVYMGLIPSARGNGWGVEISHYAQWLTRQAGRPRLVVAVDEANSPAIRMYIAAGFEVWDRRIVLQKVFG